MQTTMSTTGDRQCAFCGHGKSVEGHCGKLYQAKLANKEVLAAHKKCMQYSSGLTQYKFPSFGGFFIGKVQDEITRGKKLVCCWCKKKRTNKGPMGAGAATAGCMLKKCWKSFHFYCAKLHAETSRRQRRIKGKAVDLYRVFCSTGHKKEYLLSATGKQEVSCNDSEEDLNEDKKMTADDNNENLEGSSSVDDKNKNQDYEDDGDETAGEDDDDEEEDNTTDGSSDDKLLEGEESKNESLDSISSGVSLSSSDPESCSDVDTGMSTRKKGEKLKEAQPPKTSYGKQSSKHPSSSTMKKMVAKERSRKSSETSQDDDNETAREKKKKQNRKDRAADVQEEETAKSGERKPSPDSHTEKAASSSQKSRADTVKKRASHAGETSSAAKENVPRSMKPQKKKLDNTCDEEKKVPTKKKKQDTVGCSSAMQQEQHSSLKNSESAGDSLQNCSECVLVIPEDGTKFEPVVSDVWKKVAEEFDVTERHVHFWNMVTPVLLPSKYMLYFFKDISKKLQTENWPELKELLLNANTLQKCEAQYMAKVKSLRKLPSSQLKQEEGDMLELIETRLSKAYSGNSHRPLGALSTISSIKCFSLIINDISDPEQCLRKDLHEVTTYQWKPAAVSFAFSSDGVSPEQMKGYHLQESRALQHWFTMNFSQLHKIIVLPQEKILRCDVASSSDGDGFSQLKSRIENLEIASTSESDLPVIVFIHKINTCIVHFEHYLEAYLKKYAEDFSGQRVICVFHVENLNGKEYPKIDLGGSDCHITLFTAFNPLEKPVTLLIADIEYTRNEDS